MAQIIPTTKEQKELFLEQLEGKLNQETPLQSLAFNRVLAAVEALFFTPLYKFGVDRSKQALAITATDLSDLQKLGAEYNVSLKAATTAVLTIEIVAEDGVIIPATVIFTGDLNDVEYYPDGDTIASGGVAVVDVSAQTPGDLGNLKIDDSLTMDQQIVGASTIGTVTEIVTLGTNEETLKDYKQRVLVGLRGKPGGGAPLDYKIYAEAVPGVAAAFVYAGKPFDSLLPSYPGERTVYVQAVPEVNPDGIAPQPLLDEVRANLNNDPITGQSRAVLGLVDSALYVESIIRNPYYVKILGLVSPLEFEGQLKSDIAGAVTEYFDDIRPYVEGIDALAERNNVITALSIAEIVQQILRTSGATAEQILFGLYPDVFVNSRTLQPNERAKLGGISYV